MFNNKKNTAINVKLSIMQIKLLQEKNKIKQIKAANNYNIKLLLFLYSVPLKLFHSFNVVCKNFKTRINNCLHGQIVSSKIWREALYQHCWSPRYKPRHTH